MLSVHSHPEFLSFHRRIEFIESIKLFFLNSLIATHQFDVELNYIYLESLYLGLPLLHNSKYFSSYGQYYTDSETREASSQIDSIVATPYLEF